MSSTFGDMQNVIADELGGRSDLLANSSGLSQSPIQLAILKAIRFHDNDRFWFNENRATGGFTTVRSQEFYTEADWSEISTLHHIDKMSILIAGNRFWMRPETAQEMEDISMNASWVGQPVLYGYYNFQIRLYPIPDNAYPVNVLYTRQFAELSAAGDSNVWTNEGEAMIRARAKYYLFRDTLQDPNNAAIQLAANTQELKTLKNETFQRGATWRLTPTEF